MLQITLAHVGKTLMRDDARCRDTRSRCRRRSPKAAAAMTPRFVAMLEARRFALNGNPPSRQYDGGWPASAGCGAAAGLAWGRDKGVWPHPARVHLAPDPGRGPHGPARGHGDDAPVSCPPQPATGGSGRPRSALKTGSGMDAVSMQILEMCNWRSCSSPFRSLSGPRGRRFKSFRPDHSNQQKAC